MRKSKRSIVGNRSMLHCCSKGATISSLSPACSNVPKTRSFTNRRWALSPDAMRYSSSTSAASRCPTSTEKSACSASSRPRRRVGIPTSLRGVGLAQKAGQKVDGVVPADELGGCENLEALLDRRIDALDHGFAQGAFHP